MSLHIFEINQTIALTGHRILKGDFNIEKLCLDILELSKQGFTTFMCGMAMGFDMLAFECILNINEKHGTNLKVIACVPCNNQDRSYSKLDKLRYKTLLDLADEVIVVSQDYTRRCMMDRNKFMVDRSSAVLAYLCNTSGGTFNTVKYAKQKGKIIKLV